MRFIAVNKHANRAKLQLAININNLVKTFHCINIVSLILSLGLS